MKVLIDLNLSPAWRQVLEGAGHEAAHWLEIGDPRAPDTELMAWARTHGHVVFTHDLDFSRLLALTRALGPSVLQVRCPDPTPETIGPAVVFHLRQFREALEKGALVVIEPHRARARVLPITDR